MQSQPEWGEIINIMVTGFGAVFAIMIILALVTWGMGKVVQKLEKPKSEEKSA